MNRISPRVVSIIFIAIGLVLVIGIPIMWVASASSVSDDSLSLVLPNDNNDNGEGSAAIYVFDSAEMHGLGEMDEQEEMAVDVAKEDTRVQELLEEGADIVYALHIDSNSETSLLESLVVVGLESGDMSWQAIVDLEETRVISVSDPFTLHSLYPAPYLGIPLLIVGLFLIVIGTIVLHSTRRLP